jgi:2-(3-amino-3-carboxypropyl)histidine synthase
MKTKTFDLEEERLEEEIRKQEAKRVLIQLPEGLKAEGPHLASIAERAGAIAIVSADPCYGACDLATLDAKNLGVDLIVHYGHSPMVKEGQPQILYIEAKAKISPKIAVRKAIPLLKNWSKIGLVTTVQHVHTLEEAKKLLLKSGKIVAVGDAGHVKYAGQVTGCDYTNAKAIREEVEAFLLIGGGRFHAIGVALATTKPTIVADPYEKRAYNIDKEVRKIINQRWASISEAREAKKFGVLIGLKTGQRRLELAMAIKDKLEKNGRNTTLLALKEITPETLFQFPNIEAFVNTACPRVSLDDRTRFRRPVLTLSETLVTLDEMSWKQLCRKGWFENTT